MHCFRRTVADTALANLGPFLIGNNMYVVSEEPRLDDLVKILRKIPDLILLGKDFLVKKL